jgi:hypothetical protein
MKSRRIGGIDNIRRKQLTVDRLDFRKRRGQIIPY